jgi:hypothetical protein
LTKSSNIRAYMEETCRMHVFVGRLAGRVCTVVGKDMDDVLSATNETAPPHILLL